VSCGFPASLLLERIGAAKADLVVIGTHGRGAISRTILGSVADRLLRTSPAPVMLVPPDGRSVALRPKTIVTPTDFSPPAREALVIALAIAHENDAQLHVVHAYEIPAAVAHDESLARGLRTALSGQIGIEHPELSREANVHTHAREGAAVATILALTEEVKADLVVIASSGRGRVATLLGGVTDRVTRTAHVPVLVLRPH